MAAPGFEPFTGVGHALASGDSLVDPHDNALPEEVDSFPRGHALAEGDSLLSFMDDRRRTSAGGVSLSAAAVQKRPSANVVAGGGSLPAAAPRVRRPSSAAYKARVRVLHGKQKRTKGGLTSSNLWYSHNTGKVVSMVKSWISRNRYAGSKLATWNRCVSEARHILGIEKGRFVPVKGKTEEGQRVWATAKALFRLHG